MRLRDKRGEEGAFSQLVATYEWSKASFLHFCRFPWDVTLWRWASSVRFIIMWQSHFPMCYRNIWYRVFDLTLEKCCWWWGGLSDPEIWGCYLSSFIILWQQKCVCMFVDAFISRLNLLYCDLISWLKVLLWLMLSKSPAVSIALLSKCPLCKWGLNCAT